EGIGVMIADEADVLEVGIIIDFASDGDRQGCIGQVEAATPFFAQCIVARAAVESVIAGAAPDDVVARVAGEGVGRIAAVEIFETEDISKDGAEIGRNCLNAEKPEIETDALSG